MCILGLALGACAASSVPWVNPQVPKDRWSSDYSACRRYADRDAGWRDEAAGPNSGNAPSPLRDYERQQAKRIYEGSLANCMIDRGYVPATRSKD